MNYGRGQPDVTDAKGQEHIFTWKGGGSKASQLCIRSEHGSQHQIEERKRILTGEMTHISDFILVCVIRKVVFKLGHF